ncbi:Monogalactosyldiacylglycerol synthase [Forsythia ovata]|uniref:Monogalactosyldiacylglycerol synthase n=1 Tax=Forsythia ovata TaxID=205694 RepID=A0ABD1UCV1_9LAMI
MSAFVLGQTHHQQMDPASSEARSRWALSISNELLFNRAIKFHCERIPLSFFEDRVNSEENNGFKNNGHGFLEDSEAIKAAFMEEYGCSTIPRSPNLNETFLNRRHLVWPKVISRLTIGA